MSTKETYKLIKQDPQIWKFCFYGFFKNLRFFEPFLLLLFLEHGLSLFHIGILFAIREVFTYLFEIPSGLFADVYGKRRELLICFVFYIISFIFFYFSVNILGFAIAMVFYGLGDAFRSGTHKAIIYDYLEEKSWFAYKSFVYGRTRSFSLLGSALSSLLSIIYILNYSSLNGLFLLSILPYLADFVLIYSYPRRFDQHAETTFSFKKLFKEGKQRLISLRYNGPAHKTLLSSALFDAFFHLIKDYIQPILKLGISGSVLIYLFNTSEDESLKISLALIYGILYLLSAYASRQVYRLKAYRTSAWWMNCLFDLMGICFLLLAMSIHISIILFVILLYSFLFLFKNIRRPLFVDVIGDFLEKKERATVLSVESQTKSFLVILLAPLMGWIGDQSLAMLMLVLGGLCLVANRFLYAPEKQ